MPAGKAAGWLLAMCAATTTTQRFIGIILATLKLGQKIPIVPKGLAMCAAYLSGRVQMVCNRFAGLRAHYGIELWMLDTGTRLVPDPGLTHPSMAREERETRFHVWHMPHPEWR
jgi:hypothetical protein